MLVVRSENLKSIPAPRLVVAGTLLVSIVIGLVASFVLADWAEAASWHHGLQHVLLFIAGMGLGGSVTYHFSQTKGSK